MKKVLVTGATGLVGSKFVEIFKDKYDFAVPEYPQFELTDIENVRAVVDKVNPDVVVNFAAYTNVSEAEKQRGDVNSSCYKINVDGTRNLTRTISSRVNFIQISTDMVFPGSESDPGPYTEDHAANYDESELTWYGYTKNIAEKGMETVLRLIYPVNPSYDLKLDYLKKTLSMYDQGKLYPMFTDQQISIVLVDKIAEALDKIIFLNKKGIFHASSVDTTTPFNLISYFLKEVRGATNVVKPSSLTEFLKTVDNPARYPKFGGLKVEKTEKELDIKFGNWKEMVDKYIKDL